MVSEAVTGNECYRSSRDWRRITKQRLWVAGGLDESTFTDERRWKADLYATETALNHFDLSYQG